jgi:hypothetical protein
LFRQQEPKKWNGTFQELYAALEEKFNLKHVDMPNEDREIKRLNLGCGLTKFPGFVNVDVSKTVNPDQVVDLNVTPWPWKDNEFDHIVAKDVLEHLGNTSDDFVEVIKEMYRVSHNGAIWEIQVPHWRCDTAIDDPTHKRLITLGMFHLFNKRRLIDRARLGESDSLLAFDYNIDVEVCDVQFEYTAPYAQRIKAGDISQEELSFALNHLNNVALSTKILVQVHKPGRIDQSELESVIKDLNK